jgi:hypothetical protein
VLLGIRGILTESGKRRYRRNEQFPKDRQNQQHGRNPRNGIDSSNSSKNPWGDLSKEWRSTDGKHFKNSFTSKKHSLSICIFYFSLFTHIGTYMRYLKIIASLSWCKNYNKGRLLISRFFFLHIMLFFSCFAKILCRSSTIVLLLMF